MTATNDGSLLLAGDLGATKTNLALYRADSWPGPPLRQQTFRNRDFTEFDDLLAAFLADRTLPAAICLGVAGPILDNAVRMTNLSWSIAGAALQARFGCEQALLINDLVATAAGIPWLAPADVRPLNPDGQPSAGAAMAVLAPGSGLGEAFLVPHGDLFLPFPSEGGHASFAPRTPEQIELLSFMTRKHGHVSVEQVCSGLAIPELFAFVAADRPVPEWLATELTEALDQTPVIVQAAIGAMHRGKPCDPAVQALRLFLDILADEAANLALKTLALGGVFIGGGLAARVLPLIEAPRFMAVFARGVHRRMLARIPVQVILNPQTALLGAAASGIQALKSDPATAPSA
ncbi:glucokinase [Desulfobulbus sp.]|uniref:glucokinase n=1 Tax=Desulfobulbus sp. TaxID=895 RepID=UPI00286FA7CD|nr:glucokinase [Desulfobulbus sp.]